jgi:hypothetical protein
MQISNLRWTEQGDATFYINGRDLQQVENRRMTITNPGLSGYRIANAVISQNGKQVAAVHYDDDDSGDHILLKIWRSAAAE